jgi:serpin B
MFDLVIYVLTSLLQSTRPVPDAKARSPCRRQRSRSRARFRPRQNRASWSIQASPITRQQPCPLRMQLASAAPRLRRCTCSLRSDDGNAVVAVAPLVDALSVVYAGTAGATAAQLLDGLGFAQELAQHPCLAAELASAEGQGAVLAAGARMWEQAGLPVRAAFRAWLQAACAGGDACASADFAAAPEVARAEVNAWVAGVTRGKIPEILAPGTVNRITRLVVAAACSFKAKWVHPLTPRGELEFALPSGAKRRVAAICLSASQARFECVASDSYDAVRLPYKGIDAAMLLVRPRGALADFEAGLTSDGLASLMRGSRSAPLRLRMPRFQIDSSHSVVSALQALGVSDLFSDCADFSSLVEPGGEQLFVSTVVHNGWVAVDEVGTEAGGAAAVTISGYCMPPPPPPPFVLDLDKPFVFCGRGHAQRRADRHGPCYRSCRVQSRILEASSAGPCGRPGVWYPRSLDLGE